MGESFPVLAAALGYQASVFNLVFENNIASVKIWRRLGYQEVGRIPKAGRLANSPGKLVDAIIFYKDSYESDQESASS
jgi:RimJ/RimL family protein N-acetyltransferase